MFLFCEHINGALVSGNFHSNFFITRHSTINCHEKNVLYIWRSHNVIFECSEKKNNFERVYVKHPIALLPSPLRVRHRSEQRTNTLKVDFKMHGKSNYTCSFLLYIHIYEETRTNRILTHIKLHRELPSHDVTLGCDDKYVMYFCTSFARPYVYHSNRTYAVDLFAVEIESSTEKNSRHFFGRPSGKTFSCAGLFR